MTIDGWKIKIGKEDLPLAVHLDTGGIYYLEYLKEGQDYRAHDWAWSTDWTRSRLDDHWGDKAALLRDLRYLAEHGELRVRDAIHGIPGASPLGAIMC